MKNILASAGTAMLFLSGCASNPVPETERMRAADGASVELKDSTGITIGTLSVAVQSGGGARFTGRLTNLSPGVHAFHIYENGKCEPPVFASAGGHFNPDGKQHGQFNPNGKHAGDVGNFRVDGNGSAEVALLAEGVTLGPGANSLLKSGHTSVIVSAGPDDLKTEPDGNAGSRVACGVIMP